MASGTCKSEVLGNNFQNQPVRVHVLGGSRRPQREFERGRRKREDRQGRRAGDDSLEDERDNNHVGYVR
jgi:hypothetical protein